MGKINPNNQIILDTTMEVLKENHPITVRRLHYLLAGRIPSLYKNTLKQYNDLLRLVTTARKSGHLDYELFDDPSRVVHTPSVWEDVEDYADFARSIYQRNKWQGQPNRCEVWVEKDTVLSVFRPICRELQITLRSMHGQCSNTGCYAAAKTFSEMPDDVGINILYFGDQDPAGEQIPESAKQRTEEIMANKFDKYRDLSFIRLGFNYEDFDKFDIESIDEKPNDKQLTKYYEKYGPTAKFAELDSLPTDVLVGRVKDYVDYLIDGTGDQKPSHKRTLWMTQESLEQLDQKKISEVLQSL